MPFIFTYKEDDIVKQSIIHVDYNKGEIYSSLDLTEEVRNSVLEQLNTKSPVIPTLPQYVIDEINKIKKGDYKQDYARKNQL